MKPTILIADDDPRNIYALKAILSLKGYSILIAHNGRECVDLVASHPRVDIILMDMMMPEMDGYEATMFLRQQEKHRDLPIIAVTAQAMTGDKEKCLASGANDYLSKPIDDVQLFALIDKYIKS